LQTRYDHLRIVVIRHRENYDAALTQP